MEALKILEHFISGHVIADNVVPVTLESRNKFLSKKGLRIILDAKRLPANIPDGRYLIYDKPWEDWQGNVIPADYKVKTVYGGERYLMRIEE